MYLKSKTAINLNDLNIIQEARIKCKVDKSKESHKHEKLFWLFFCGFKNKINNKPKTVKNEPKKYFYFKRKIQFFDFQKFFDSNNKNIINFYIINKSSLNKEIYV